MVKETTQKNQTAIGLDIGTTTISLAVLDIGTKTVVETCTAANASVISSDMPWEHMQSPEWIWEKSKELLDTFLKKYKVSSIGVTGQMHGIMYTSPDGKVLSPLYTWQDERGNLPYKNTTYAGYLNSFAGYGNVTDFYNRCNGIRPVNAVSYSTIHDYFVMKLCGLKRPLIHSTDAASLGCYNIDENKFDYDFNPDIILFPAEGLIHFNNIGLYLSKLLKKPIGLFFVAFYFPDSTKLCSPLPTPAFPL